MEREHGPKEGADMILEAIRTRRSCKKYLPDPVPEEIVEKIIDAGLHAANGKGKQSPVILAVTDRETRDALMRLNAKYDPDNRPDPFYGAPVVLAVLGPEEWFTTVEDGSLVIGNMMLAAHAIGVGSCWIHRARQTFDDPEGREILRRAGIPDNYIGIGNCVIGHPEIVRKEPAAIHEGRVFRI